MIILTAHGKERIKERYNGSIEEFIRFAKKFFKKLRNKKLANYKIKFGKNGKKAIYWRNHKIVYVKERGDYLIVSYCVRMDSNIIRGGKK